MEPKFEFVMSVRLKLGNKKVIGRLAKGGERIFIEILEGTFAGPNLKGIVLPGCGDWAHFQPNGVIVFDARYHLQEDDGTLIYLMNRGFRWGTPESMQKMAGHQEINFEDYYMRTSPTFEVQEGPHDWLSKYVFFGIGEKTPEGNVIHYYKVL